MFCESPQASQSNLRTKQVRPRGQLREDDHPFVGDHPHESVWRSTAGSPSPFSSEGVERLLPAVTSRADSAGVLSTATGTVLCTSLIRPTTYSGTVQYSLGYQNYDLY